MLRELGSYILPENSCFCGAKEKTFLKHVLHEVYTTWQTSTRINTSRVNEYVEICLWEKFKTFQKVNNLTTYDIFFSKSQPILLHSLVPDFSSSLKSSTRFFAFFVRFHFERQFGNHHHCVLETYQTKVRKSSISKNRNMHERWKQERTDIVQEKVVKRVGNGWNFLLQKRKFGTSFPVKTGEGKRLQTSTIDKANK